MNKYSDAQNKVLKEFEKDDKFNLCEYSVEAVANDGDTMEFLILHDLFNHEWNAIHEYIKDSIEDISFYHCSNIVNDNFGSLEISDFICNISHKNEIMQCFKSVYPNKSIDEINEIFAERTSWSSYENLSQQEKNEYLKERHFSLEDYENETDPEMKNKILEKIREDISDWNTSSFNKEEKDDYPFGDDYY